MHKAPRSAPRPETDTPSPSQVESPGPMLTESAQLDGPRWPLTYHRHGTGAAMRPAGTAVLGDVLVSGDTGVVDPIHVRQSQLLGRSAGQVLMRPGCVLGTDTTNRISAGHLSLSRGGGGGPDIFPSGRVRGNGGDPSHTGRSPPSQTLKLAPTPTPNAGTRLLWPCSPKCRSVSLACFQHR